MAIQKFIRLGKLSSVFLISILAFSQVNAASTTIPASEIGSFNSKGGNLLTPDFAGYVGTIGNPPVLFRPGNTTIKRDRGFLSFDVSSVTTNIVSATLRITITDYVSLSQDFNPPFGVNQSCNLVPNSSELVRVTAVQTPLADLKQSYPLNFLGFNQLGLPIFQDLGTGLYAEFAVTQANAGTTIDIPLNANTLAAISAATGTFQLGLDILSNANSGTADTTSSPIISCSPEEKAFRISTDATSHQLILKTSAVAVTTAQCSIEMDQSTYINGDVVTISRLEFGGIGYGQLAVEIKSWMTMPDGINVPLLQMGQDGSIYVYGGYSENWGPQAVMAVLPSTLTGPYTASCLVMDPVTGGILHKKTTNFVIGAP